MSQNIDNFLTRIKKPSRYIGHEINACCKPWDEAAFKIALVFPDLYEIGMSHHGLRILYAVINEQEDLLADRVYAPDRDFENLLQQTGTDIFGVESRRPLAEFDMIGITLPYELCYTNILTILSLGRIPLRSAERDDRQPYIIGGGSGSFNPEPVADFFDAILLGDGEEAALEIAAVLKSARTKGLQRRKTLEKLADIQGVYVPSLFRPRYDSSNTLLAIEPLLKGYETVRRRILADLDDVVVQPPKPLVPLARIVHDRLGIEVARGCTRGCRFCQAGIIYRPVRERGIVRIIEIAEKGMAAGGFEELALLSLSTGDYSCLSPLLSRLMNKFVKDHVSISMPSMRVGTLTQSIMNQIRRVRKTGFTLAPEAGTDRLRRVINKGITEEDLLQTCRDAHALGWKLLKFYFMIGLPTETTEDVMAIADLVQRAAQTASGRPLRINVSVATFVPKPHTPFQWEPQISIAESFARFERLKKSLHKGNYKLKWHDPKQSFLEGVMSRGDRKLSYLIEQAWRSGARLDAWSDHYDLNIWEKAADRCNLEIDNYLRRRDFSEVLPWQHLDTGVDAEFLLAELEKSLQGGYTPDCRRFGCQQCGVCDFKHIKPEVQEKTGDDHKTAEFDDPEQATAAQTDGNTAHNPYRLIYSKQGDMRYLSHLELIQLLFQAFRRAGLKLHYTKGYNPVPKVTFSPALPVGTESLTEYLDMDLRDKISDLEGLRQTINRQLPPGLAITSVFQPPAKFSDEPSRLKTSYQISLPREFMPADFKNLQEFMARENHFITKIRKGRKRKLDIRRQVESFTCMENGIIDLVVIQEDGKAAGRPAEICRAALNLTAEEVVKLRILKTEISPSAKY